MEKIIIFLGMLVGTFISAIASLMLKLGSKEFNLHFSIKGIVNILKNTKLILGISMYIVSTIIFIYLLRNTELSFLYPLTSLTYIYVTILSYYILKEKINKYKVSGIFLVVSGLVLISISSII